MDEEFWELLSKLPYIRDKDGDTISNINSLIFYINLTERTLLNVQCFKVTNNITLSLSFIKNDRSNGRIIDKNFYDFFKNLKTYNKKRLIDALEYYVIKHC